MSDNGYQTMLCLETANALADSRVLEAGESHCLGGGLWRKRSKRVECRENPLKNIKTMFDKEVLMYT